MQAPFCEKNNFGVLNDYHSVFLLEFAKEEKKNMNTDKEKIAVEFGNFIREARESKGMFQADIAAKIGVSRGYYSYIESGSREIYFSLAVKICDVLKLDMSDFVKLLK